MYAILRIQAHRWTYASAEILKRCLARPLPGCVAHKQQYSRMHSTKQNAVSLLDPDTDVEAAVAAAIMAAGRESGPAEAELVSKSQAHTAR